MRQTTITGGGDENRPAIHARQVEAAREAAKSVGGKFVSDRGNDCWGHPVVGVIDAQGCRVEEIRQEP